MGEPARKGDTTTSTRALPSRTSHFDPRGLSINFRRVCNGEFWEARVGGQQPFAGTHAWGRRRREAMRHLFKALATFRSNEG